MTPGTATDNVTHGLLADAKTSADFCLRNRSRQSSNLTHGIWRQFRRVMKCAAWHPRTVGSITAVLLLIAAIQVVRIDALRDVALMQDVHPIRDGADVLLIRKAVSVYEPAINHQMSIAVRVQRPGPQPASGRLVDSGNESTQRADARPRSRSARYRTVTALFGWLSVKDRGTHHALTNDFRHAILAYARRPA